MLLKQVRPEAIKRIQTSLVLEAIAKDAKIKITDKAVDAEIAKMAEMYKMEVEQLKNLMGDAEKESMKKDLAIQGAVDLIMKNVVVVDKEEATEEVAEEKPAAKKTTKKAAKKDEE